MHFGFVCISWFLFTSIAPTFLGMNEILRPFINKVGASLVALTVKNLPAMLETWVQPLSQEDPLEKDMATHSSILAWRIP